MTSNVLEQLLARSQDLDKSQRRTIINLEDVIEVDEKTPTPETQSKLGRAWQELQGITDFTNNSLEVGAKVAQHWPAITGWLTAIGAYLGG